MKKLFTTFMLVALVVLSGCSKDEAAEPFTNGTDEEEIDIESYRNKFVIINNVEETMYLIKHVDANGKAFIQNTDTLEFGKASRLKGSNDNQTTIAFRWSKKAYPDHNYFETVEASFSVGYPGRYVEVTMEEDIYQIKIILKE